MESDKQSQSDSNKPLESSDDTDVFAWANNLVQYKDELNLDLFFISRNYTLYKTKVDASLKKFLEPIFIDEILEYILEGVEQGLVVRNFEEAEAEHKVLQRTKIQNIASLKEVMNWLNHQYAEIPLFSEEEHDFRRIRGVMTKVTYPNTKIDPFYVFKVLPKSQVMTSKMSWLLKDSKFVKFDGEAVMQLSLDPQLLLLADDLYVFNQTKLKQLFGYDAKEASVAASKVKEILENFKLRFDDGMDLNKIVEGKKALIKKLQKVDAGLVSQEDLLSHAEEMGVDLMQDETGAIIIMDDKDATKFVNLLNDDYVESPMTGMRYEIVNKKALKAIDPDN